MSVRAELVERCGVASWRTARVDVDTAVLLVRCTPWFRRVTGEVDGVPFVQVPTGFGSVARVWGQVAW